MTVSEWKEAEATAERKNSLQEIVDYANDLIDKESRPVRIVTYRGAHTVELLVSGKRKWKIVAFVEYDIEKMRGYWTTSPREEHSKTHYFINEEKRRVEVETPSAFAHRVLSSALDAAESTSDINDVRCKLIDLISFVG